MSNRLAALLVSTCFVLISGSADAGQLTSTFEMNTSGTFEMEGQGTQNITGGIIKVRYPAIGTRTPDPSGKAVILSGSIQFTDDNGSGYGTLDFQSLPKSFDIEAAGPGFITLSNDFVYLTGSPFFTVSMTSGYVYFTLKATLPPIASLPALSNLSLVSFYGEGDAPGTTISTIYTSFGPPPGNEIGRTFEADSAVPMFIGGSVLPAAALLVVGIVAVARRRRA